MTLNEFIELQESVVNGEEFCFDYQNEEFWISKNSNVYYITRSRDSFTQEFDTSDTLFKNGTIDDRLLSDIYTEIEW